MKKSIFPIFVLFCIFGCSKDHHEILSCECVNEIDEIPVASFSYSTESNYCHNGIFPGTKINLKSTATDSENTIESYHWLVNNVLYSGISIEITPETKGIYSIKHWVKDKINTSEVFSDKIEVTEFPSRIKVKLIGIHAGPDAGDGYYEPGEVFFVINSVKENPDGKLEVVQQYITPLQAPTSYTFDLWPNSYQNFYFRGITLFEGSSNDRWGTSFIVMEYDPATSCGVCSILGDVLPIIGILLEPVVPGAKTVGAAAGEISDLINVAVSEDENTTVLSHIELDYGPEDKNTYGCIQSAYFNNIQITYKVELIP